MGLASKQAANYRHIEVAPITGVIGAEIRGVDLRSPLSADAAAEILSALDQWGVIVLPSQDISNEAHEAFAGIFGPVGRVPQLHNVDGLPNVQIIRRRAQDTGRVVGENWHADSTFLDEPPAAVVMRAVEVPPYGGDTGFLSMTAAYEALSETFRSVIDNLNVVHSATRVFGSLYRVQSKRFDVGSTRLDLNVEDGDREVIHPLVCRHPRSGAKHLFLNRTYSQRIDGMSNEESAALMQLLFDHCSRFDLTCRIRWQPNQVLVWDNRSTMHRAIADYAGFDRLLTRVTINGERPAR